MTPDSTTGGAGAAGTSYRATGSAMDSPSTLRVVADTAVEMAMESQARTCSADGLAEAKQQAWVLHPDHVYRKRWDMVQVVALLYVAILVPARTGFAIDLEPGSWTWWLELCVDVYFIGDIFVNFRTGFFDDGVLEMRPKRIARSYAKQWLSVDVVSCLPIPYITLIMASMSENGEASGQGSTTKLFKILRLLRLAKLLRLGRLKKIIKRHEEEFENLMGVFKVGGSIVAMGYTCHLVACGWYFIGDDVTNPELGWIKGQMNDVWNATGDQQEVGFSTRYITSYYWAITTISTVGFGDITGKTDSERLYSIIAEMFGCLMFAVLIGSLGSMMVGQKLLEEKVEKQVCELREFMEAKGIPKDLRVKIRHYMETLYESKSGFDESEVLSQLPPAMAQELLSHMYQKILGQVAMFNNLEEGAITQICALIKPLKAMEGDMIYKNGEVGREIYIIIEGIVEIQYTGNYTTSLAEMKKLKAGATFGEGCASELFEYDDEDEGKREPFRREDTAVARTDCDLKFLTLDNLRDVCSEFPSARAEMWLMVDIFHRNRLAAQIHHWNAAEGTTGEGDSGVSAVTVEIAETMKKKLMQKLEKHQKHQTAALAGSKSPGARAGNLKGKASEGAATNTVAFDAGGKQHVPLPGTVNIPSPSHPTSSVHGEDTTRGSSGVGSDDPGNLDIDRRSRSKTMIPAASPSPGFKPSRRRGSLTGEAISRPGNSVMSQNADEQLQILNSSVARLEGRMGKLEAIVEKKMDAMLTMLQGQQQQSTPQEQEPRPPREP